MAGYKETPRQKMIAMMYLVLTALLALNVSVEILEAFIVVNEGMETTNENLNRKVIGAYSKFEQQYSLNPKKVAPFFLQAKNAHKLSSDMINYLEKTKYQAIAYCEGITYEQAQTTPLRNLDSKDNYDKSTNFFIGDSQDGSAGRAKELKVKLEEYTNKMTAFVDPKVRGTIKESTNMKGPFHDASGVRQNWEMHHFYHTILAADVTILNKIISDVRGYEFDVLNHLYSSISEEDFKFNKIEAKVIPKSNYVFLGDTYEADIFVAASDDSQNPEVIVNGSAVKTTAGMGHYMASASSEGLKTYSGFIRAKDATGAMISYPFKNEYIVAPPTLTVSPTKMNVFYIGVENPVSISAGGLSDAQLIPTITSPATISRAAGGRGWVVRVSGGARTAKISISAKVEGKIKTLGGMEFRIKRVPSPTAKIGNTDGGVINKNLLLASGGLIPSMPEDFEFNLNFEIISYTFLVSRGGDIITRTIKGNILTQEVKNIISGMKRGDRIWFEDIYAKGPDGNRKLNNISLQVQ
jgi:gliding motility-associated protein GldM